METANNNKKTAKVTYYVGLNDKDSKLQEISTLEAFKVVQNVVCSLFGGGTIFEADGVYTHIGGVIICEKTLRIEVFNFGIENFDAKVLEFCDVVKKALNQESISVQREFVQSELI